MPKAKNFSKGEVKMWKGPPYSYKVLVNGKWIMMCGFHKEHIINQLYPKKAKNIRKVR